jgi:hypothetical protein
MWNAHVVSSTTEITGVQILQNKILVSMELGDVVCGSNEASILAYLYCWMYTIRIYPDKDEPLG